MRVPSDGLEARGAEPVHGHGRRRHWDARRQARDARDVHALLGFRGRATQDHIVDQLGLERRNPPEGSLDRLGGHIIRPHPAKAPLRGFPDRRPDARDNDRFRHVLGS